MRMLALEPKDLDYYERLKDMELAKEFLNDGVKLILYTGGREIYEIENLSDFLTQKDLYDMKVIPKFDIYID